MRIVHHTPPKKQGSGTRPAFAETAPEKRQEDVLDPKVLAKGGNSITACVQCFNQYYSVRHSVFKLGIFYLAVPHYIHPRSLT